MGRQAREAFLRPCGACGSEAATMPQTPDTDETISALVEAVPYVTPEAHGVQVNEFFERHPSAEGLAVVEGERPIGLVMRNDFFQKLGSPYGRELFLKRPVRLIMNPRPLIVDASVSLGEISMLAMAREQQGLYDLVVVTDEDRYAGAVSIKNFLIVLSQKRAREIELLKSQRELLEQAHRAEVESRRLIEAKSASIRNLLDNAGQGFLSFGPDLAVSDEHSLECIHLFRGPVAGKDFTELLGRHLDENARQTLSQALARVFTAKAPLQRKVYLSLLPGRLSLYDRIVTMEFKLIQDAGEPRVMAVLTDVTEKEELRRRMERERANLRMIVKAVSDPGDLLAALEELRTFFPEGALELIAAAQAPAQAQTELFRAVHTFKGDFSQRRMENAGARLHEIEDAMDRLARTPLAVSGEALRDIVLEMDAQDVLGEDLAAMTQVLGPAFFEPREDCTVPRHTIRRLENMVARLLPPEDAAEPLALLRSIRLHNLKDMLAAYKDTLRGLAARLGKNIADLEVQGDDVLVERGVYQPFVKSLVHVLRNMADHGVEPVEERLAAGKPAQGRVVCQVAADGAERFRIIIRDDGAGIDFEKVRAKAATVMDPLEAACLSQEQLAELLFQDSFSTKEEVSLVSGRGVGLAAVRAEAHKLSGRIQVVSQRGAGTEFHFELPLILRRHGGGRAALRERPASSALQ